MTSGLPPAIESILTAGNAAPSGENSQPWRFAVRGDHIEIHELPERDTSDYNWGSRGSLMAIGAVIENMVITASTLGFRCDVHLFPMGDTMHVASLELFPQSSIEHSALEPFVLLRTTNRKKYMPIRLSDREKETLYSTANGSPDVQLHITDERADIARLASAGALNEEIMLSNKRLHEFFFSHINWSKQEDDMNKTGFYIKTLELPTPVIALFYLIKDWRIMEQLVQLGFHTMVRKQNASVYARSSAIGAISIADDMPKSYIEAGRVMERVWLNTTRLGMHFQPITGILFFKLKIDRGGANVFLPEQVEQINEEYKEAQRIFKVSGRRLAFMFRIGSGAAPSARSSRFPLEKVVTALQ